MPLLIYPIFAPLLVCFTVSTILFVHFSSWTNWTDDFLWGVSRQVPQRKKERGRGRNTSLRYLQWQQPVENHCLTKARTEWMIHETKRQRNAPRRQMYYDKQISTKYFTEVNNDDVFPKWVGENLPGCGTLNGRGKKNRVEKWGIKDW